MTTYTIDQENNVTAYASAKEAKGQPQIRVFFERERTGAACRKGTGKPLGRYLEQPARPNSGEAFYQPKGGYHQNLACYSTTGRQCRRTGPACALEEGRVGSEGHSKRKDAHSPGR